jgi:predicted outer membrane repeat protein
MRTRPHYIAIVLLLGVSFLIIQPAQAARTTIGSGAVIGCTEAALNAALAAGGEITFNCGTSPATIPITSEKQIGKATTIDGGGLVTLSGQNARRIFKTANNISFTVKNLTLADGLTAGQGGAIEVGFWNSFTATNVVFRNNRSTSDGQACDGGGAIYIDGGRGAQDGGPDQAVLRGNTYTSNTTNNHGGAIFAGSYSGDSVLIDQSTFDGNRVTKAASLDSSGTGGAVWYGFGASGVTNYGLIVTNSTFVNNSADTQGGGLWTDGPATLTNVTFSGNQAVNPASLAPDDWRRGNGGALSLCCDAPVVITSATFAGNHARFNGGAIVGKTITIKDTLFANNTSANPWNIMQHCTDALTDAGNTMQYPPRNPSPNFSNETNCSATIRIADPKLGTLADNGGPTRTIALLAGSPARNAGAGCPATDQRGVARPQGSACDVGAYEAVERLLLSPAVVFVGDKGRAIAFNSAHI